MFKIGDFSKICQTSIKALRYWDEIDLLKPAHIDPDSGYRYYDITQLGQVNRIIAYKGLGLSLKQIAQLLEEDLPPGEIRGMLRLKQAELQQQIEEQQAMLALVETRLNQIEQEGKLPEVEVALKTIPSQTALTIRDTMQTMNDLVELIFAARAIREKHHTQAKSPLLAVFHDEAFQQELLDVEVGFVVPANYREQVMLPDERPMQVKRLPEVELMASHIHRGRWAKLVDGYSALGRWINQNGYKIVGVGREIFHHIGGDDTVTEVQFPVTRA